MVLAVIATTQQKVTLCLRRLPGGAPEGRDTSLDPSHHDPRAAAGAPAGRSGARVALPVPCDSAKCSQPSVGPRRAVPTTNCSTCLPSGYYGAAVQPGTARYGGSGKREGNLHVACRHFIGPTAAVCLSVTSRNWQHLSCCASRRGLRSHIGQIK
jgi:hypothetical protein